MVLTLTASYRIGRLFGVSHHLATPKRRRPRRGHRRQLVHDRPEPGVGFGLKAAMPSRHDRVIAGIAQGPHQGFRLVEMAHPIVTPMRDMNGDVPQSGDKVENIVVIAIRHAAGAKESAPSPTAKSLPLAPAGTASNFAWSGKKTATLYRMTVPADPVLVNGNRLGGAKGPQPVPLQCDAPPCGPPP